ncbi:MAG TPA: PilZ domain-containing protein [Xanthobacteraceae bacterium]|nr:PilZ domain-containing protein [Xanthobacteraceae bacterium]
MGERRRRTRAISSEAAVIACSGAKRITCVVRNFSTTGARLEVAVPAAVPETFDLVFDDSRSTLPCRVKWRRERALGVEFRLPHP